MVTLPQQEIDAWIAALRQDITATATAQPVDDPWAELMGRSKTKPATWRLGMFASAYFYVVSQQDVERLVALIPQLHAEFQALTGNALQRYLRFGTGAIARRPPTQEEIVRRFQEKFDDVVSVTAFDAPSKEASSTYSLEGLCQFSNPQIASPVFRPGIDTAITDREIEIEECTLGLDYFTVQFPLSFWRTHHEPLRRWWLGALQRLQAVQAYSGLGIGLPPTLERYPFQQKAEFAMARQFLGLDVDKPFFAVSNRPYGKHLECGMRTPSFGVLVAGDYLARLGGMEALRSQLQSVSDASGQPALRLEPCQDGLWIEAGAEPALHSIEQGVPGPLRALAEALKPVRLQQYWAVSYPPNIARNDIFSPDSAARWLRRFDVDSDWAQPL